MPRKFCRPQIAGTGLWSPGDSHPGSGPELAAQITDAANSIALNLGEGELSDPGNRRARYHSAAGSASEVRAGIRVARAWGYVSEAQAMSALIELDRLLAILWKLTH